MKPMCKYFIDFKGARMYPECSLRSANDPRCEYHMCPFERDDWQNMGEELCKYFEQKPEDLWAIFAVEKIPNLYKDVGDYPNTPYSIMANPVEVVAIQITEGRSLEKTEAILKYILDDASFQKEFLKIGKVQSA